MFKKLENVGARTQVIDILGMYGTTRLPEKYFGTSKNVTPHLWNCMEKSWITPHRGIGSGRE